MILFEKENLGGQFFIMQFEENVLCHDDYCRLRNSVGWLNFSKEQAERAIDRC